MKKINILLSLLALSFMVTSCGKEPGVDSLDIDDSASYYLRDTKIVAPSENVSEPVFVDSVKSGNSLFVQYKLGTIKKSFIQSMVIPRQYNGLEKSIEVQSETLSNERLSSSLSSYVSNSTTTYSTREIDNGSKFSINCDWKNMLKNVALDLVSQNYAKAAVDVLTSFSGKVDKSKTLEEITEEYVKSLTEESTVAESITKSFSTTITYSFENCKVGKYFTIGLFGDVDVYQLIEIDLNTNKIVSSIIQTGINQNSVYTKLVWSDTKYFDIPEDLKFKPLSEITINVDELTK